MIVVYKLRTEQALKPSFIRFGVDSSQQRNRIDHFRAIFMLRLMHHAIIRFTICTRCDASIGSPKSVTHIA
ncbi:hypothetical protein PQR39_15980 [Paraburkholderia sediminicola]|uniref:hypothetical protein n=1 Tax=Paraburkholderia sediminicola TaxID=458836 RepID=UPI0038BBF49B